MHACKWMDGWDGWMDGWLDGWMCMHMYVNVCTYMYMYCKWQQLQLQENDDNFGIDPVQTNDKPDVPKDQTVLSPHALCSCCFPMPAKGAKVPD